jgi:phosphoglycolate phosphatase
VNKYELLVFDWDGTLFDSTGLITESIQRAAADLELPVPTRAMASHVIGLGLNDALRMAVPSIKSEQIPMLVDRYRHHYVGRESEVTLFEGIRPMLENLARGGVRLAVATGKNRIGLSRVLKSSGLGYLFEATRCADEGEPKPHPWMLRDLGDETGVAPEQMLMVGDTTHDLGMAQAAGSAFLGVTYGAHDAQSLRVAYPVKVVDTVPEMVSFFEQSFAGFKS